MIGWVRQLAIWGGIGLLVYAFVANRLPTPQTAPPAPVAAATAPAAPARASYLNSQVFRASGDGHVRLDADVNGAPVRFMVDTGATMVTLTTRDAASAGLSGSALNFTARMSTANGGVRAAPVMLREVRIRDLSIENIPGMVVENLNVSLLGQSFLTRLDSYEMRDSVLTLSYY
jgi:aspartyl protease family protein